MRRAAALLALAGMLVGTILAFFAPWPALALVCLAGAGLMRGRRAYLVFCAISIPVNVAILWGIDRDGGALRGLEGGLRLAAALAVNLTILSRVGAERLLDGLHLPPRATAFLAAILLASHELGRDFARLRDARRLEGAWPASRLARARDSARLVPALLVAAVRRASARHDALQLAGIGFPTWFVPVVAVAALAAAGRMAFLALPNVALTYVVVFLGGMLFGPWVAAAGGFAGMLLTDLLFTGLYPGGFVNAPAMAVLGLVGGALRSTRPDPATSAAIGIVATFLFSVLADTGTWLLLYRDEPAAWRPLVALGLVFNVIPALVNGALFAASVSPTVRAFRAWREAPSTPQGAATAPASDVAPPLGS